MTADLTNGKQNIFLATRDGMAICFQEEYDPERNGIGLRPMGRNAAGNKGISLKKGDYVIGAAITSSDETGTQSETSAPKRAALLTSSPPCARATRARKRPCSRPARSAAMEIRKTRS